MSFSGSKNYSESSSKRRVISGNKKLLQSSFDLSRMKIEEEKEDSNTNQSPERIMLKSSEESEEESTELHSDVLHTEKQNREFYKKKLQRAIENSFTESAEIRLENLKHPSQEGLKARRVLDLVPCIELLGERIVDVNLVNKLEKTGEGALLGRPDILGRVGVNLHEERILQMFNIVGSKKENEPLGEGKSEDSLDLNETLQKEDGNKDDNKNVLSQQLTEYATLKKMGTTDNDQHNWLLLVGNDNKAKVKLIDYDLIVRGKKRNLSFEGEYFEIEATEDNLDLREIVEQRVGRISKYLKKKLIKQGKEDSVLWENDHKEFKKVSKGKKKGGVKKEVSKSRLKVEEGSSDDSLFAD